jgi:hypothetical protein
MRKLLLFLLLALPLTAANLKLYLKDGGFQIVREYQVEGDRVKFYSIERSDWEEMPASLVDLKRTDAEAGERKAVAEEEARQVADEQELLKQNRAEIRKIPTDPGLYRLENNELRVFSEIESTVHNDKGRQALKILSPLPLVTGKSTLEVAGEHSANVVTEDRPEFFLQLATVEDFAIFKLTPQKGIRLVEKISIVPVTKEIIEEPVKVQIFQKELSDSGLFKIWPQEPLEKGEYAVVEYTPQKMNQKVWDFRIQ